MLNEFTVAGRVIDIGEPRYLDNGKQFLILKLACQRDFKPYGKPLYDHILFAIFRPSLMKQVNEYIRKGQVITVTGRIQTIMMGYTDVNGEFKKRPQGSNMVEKIYFDKQREPLATEEEMAKYTPEQWDYIQTHDFIDGEEEQPETGS